MVRLLSKRTPSKERLLVEGSAGTEMQDLEPIDEAGASKPSKRDAIDQIQVQEAEQSQSASQPAQYRVYKRRFLGLLQLVLLNVVVSWDVCFDIESSAFTNVLTAI